MIELNAVAISSIMKAIVRFVLSVTNRYTTRISIKSDSTNMSYPTIRLNREAT